MRALLDRDAELAELARRLATAHAGPGGVIVVEGPAGIGKSTLLEVAGQTAGTRGALVLRARCSPLEQHAAWGVARQLFEPLRAGPGWDALTEGAARLAERALAPEGTEPAAAGDAMHAAVRGLVALASNLGPAVLAIDDVHWADAPSLHWLAVLARSLADLRLGVLCAVRSGEPPGAPDLLAELLAAAPEPPVRPRALGVAATRSLVLARLPGASPGFAHACHAVTGGNPFLLHALTTQLAADGTPPDDEAAARLETFGSDQVARALERQLARLPGGAAALARALAVLGPGAPLRHAANLARLDSPAAPRAADALRAAGLLDPGPRLTLAHPLIAGTLYSSLPAGERALMHAGAARLLARERADPERIALHLLRTEPEADATTVGTLREAATRAAARGAPQTSSVFLRRALDEPPPDGAVEAEVRHELGLALAAHVQPEAPALLAAAVELAPSARRRAELALSAARALGLAGYFDDAIVLCRGGLAHAGQLPAELRARLEAELVADAWLNAATVPEAHARLDQQAPLELWRINRAWEAVCAGRPVGEARSILAAALDAGALDGDPDSLLGTWAKLVLIANGDLDEACARCAGLIDLARPRGWGIALAHGSFLRAIALVQAGRIRDAEADARLAFDFKLANSLPAAVIWGLFPLVDALTELGQLADADAALAAAGLLEDAPPGALSTALLLESRGRLRLAERRHADAHADLVAARDRWNEFGIRHPGLAAWRVHDSEALLALGDVATARRLAEEHLELAEILGLPGPRGAGLRALARTLPRDEAVASLEHAVDLLTGSSAQLEHARALADLGAALRRANRRAAARDPLRRALDLCDRGGMVLLGRRVRQELHAAGGRPRRNALSGPGALTPAEHRVTRLAAEGLGNRAIAERLYVTERTVETHLTHAFQKLGIGSRTELAAALEGTAEPALTS